MSSCSTLANRTKKIAVAIDKMPPEGQADGLDASFVNNLMSGLIQIRKTSSSLSSFSFFCKCRASTRLLPCHLAMWLIDRLLERPGLLRAIIDGGGAEFVIAQPRSSSP